MVSEYLQRAFGVDMALLQVRYQYDPFRFPAPGREHLTSCLRRLGPVSVLLATVRQAVAPPAAGS
jgi:hypothetical protein